MKLYAEEILQKLSLKEKLAQLMMIDFTFFGEKEGAKCAFEVMNVEVEKLLQEYPVGALALFATNCKSNDKTFQLVRDIQNTHWVPKFIGIDQEGGIVYRLKEGSKTPGNMALGRKDDTMLTKKMSEIMSLELSTLGINLNFAPTVDVNSNPKNPIIGVRSFSESPEVVTRHALAYIEGMRTHGVLSCAKHFPGHGNTVLDSHLGTTYSENTLNEIENVDFPPFKACIENGVEMIMTAHIVAKELDSNTIYSKKLNKYIETPATLSKKILTDILRNELGFKGIILTDALVMKAIEDNFSPVESSKFAICAGADMVVMPLKISSTEEIEIFKNYFNELYQAALKDKEFLGRIENSCRRLINKKILSLSEGFDAIDNEVKKREQYALMKKNVGSDVHQNYCLKIAKELVLYHGKGIAKFEVRGKNILVLAQKKMLLETSQNFLEKNGAFVTSQLCEYNAPIHVEQGRYDAILVITYNLTHNDHYINSYIAEHTQSESNVVVISSKNPYDCKYLKDAPHIVECFGVSGFDQTNEMITIFTTNFLGALSYYFQ